MCLDVAHLQDRAYSLSRYHSHLLFLQHTYFLKQLGSLSYMLMINNSTFALKIVELTTTPAARTLSEKME